MKQELSHSPEQIKAWVKNAATACQAECDLMDTDVFRGRTWALVKASLHEADTVEAWLNKNHPEIGWRVY